MVTVLISILVRYPYSTPLGSPVHAGFLRGTGSAEKEQRRTRYIDNLSPLLTQPHLLRLISLLADDANVIIKAGSRL